MITMMRPRACQGVFGAVVSTSISSTAQQLEAGVGWIFLFWKDAISQAI
jgi:hypothetical protein